MKRQNSAQEDEIIELQEDNVEEREAAHNMPLNTQTIKVGISFARLILSIGENTTQQEKLHFAETSCRGGLIIEGKGKVYSLESKAEDQLNMFVFFSIACSNIGMGF